MKKTTLIYFSIALISLSSCNKDYTCTCEKKVTATGAALPTIILQTGKQTKKHAEEQCKGGTQAENGNIPADETWTCTLK